VLPHVAAVPPPVATPELPAKAAATVPVPTEEEKTDEKK